MDDQAIEKEIQPEGLSMPRGDFGFALAWLKAGQRVWRVAGWNGKGMFAYLVPANSYPAQTGAAKAHFGEGSLVPYNAYLALKGADDTVSTWAPSGSDALAEDWQIVATTLLGAPPIDNAHVAPGCEQFSAADIAANARPPHQQRVIDEKADLGEKIHKLVDFFDTPIFTSLAADEQLRLQQQAVAMDQYFTTLLARIAAFTPA